jgi:hypothetical protein
MSSITSKSSKGTVLARVRALITGTEKHFSTTTFVLGKTAYTAATLTEALQRLADAIVRLNALHASVKDAVMELRAIETQVAPLMRDYQRVVLAAFSTGAQELADFGMQPPKARTPMDSEKRAGGNPGSASAYRRNQFGCARPPRRVKVAARPTGSRLLTSTTRTHRF